MVTASSAQQEILRTAAFARQHALTARQRHELDFARRFEKLAASAEQLAATLASQDQPAEQPRPE